MGVFRMFLMALIAIFFWRRVSVRYKCVNYYISYRFGLITRIPPGWCTVQVSPLLPRGKEGTHANCRLPTAQLHIQPKDKDSVAGRQWGLVDLPRLDQPVGQRQKSHFALTIHHTKSRSKSRLVCKIHNADQGRPVPVSTPSPPPSLCSKSRREVHLGLRV